MDNEAMTGPTMTAAYVDDLGPAGGIRVGLLPVPVLGSADVLVAVEVVGLNHVDTYVRSGRYPTPVPRPFVVGRDLVGTVAAAPETTGFSAGDRVWCNSLGHEGRQGSFAQYAAVPPERLYRLPDGVDPETAVAVAHPATTAFLGWFVHAQLRPAETVFVGGGGGNVGTAAIQMAAFAGARVIASSRPEDFEHCRLAGAEVVLDYRDQQLAERVAEAAPEAVNIVWDTSGHHDFGLVATAGAPGARVLVTAATSPSSSVPLPQLYTRDVSVLGFVISRASVEDLVAAASLINDMLSHRLLTTQITEVLPLEQTEQAHQRLEAGKVSGRVVLRPSPRRRGR